MTRALPAALIAAVALALPALAPPASAADPILSRLAGDWTGRGSYKQSPDAAAEKVFCKVTNTLVQNGSALQQRGRCSITSGSSAIDGLIQATGGGRYSGSIDSLVSEGPATFTGTGGGGSLTLSMRFTDARTHAPARSVTTMTLTGGGYHLTSRRQDGGGWTPSDITFSK